AAPRDPCSTASSTPSPRGAGAWPTAARRPRSARTGAGLVDVPREMRRPDVAARALSLVPLALAGRTDAAGLERVPDVQAGTGPGVLPLRLPRTARAPNPGAAGIARRRVTDVGGPDLCAAALPQQLDHR